MQHTERNTSAQLKTTLNKRTTWQLVCLLMWAVYGGALAGTPVVKLNGSLVAGGNVNTSDVSPDGSRVVYRADQDIDGVFEVFSVPVNGGVVVKLNEDLSVNQDVNSFAFTPDSQLVIYIADQNTTGQDELFSVPIDGGSPTRLNKPLPSGGRITGFTISPDGSRVVFSGDQDTNDVFELYSVPVIGGEVVKLNAPMVNGGDLFGFNYLISPDSHWVVYRADQDIVDVNELYSVPIVGGAVTKLNEPLSGGRDVGLFNITVISPDSGTVVFGADQDTNNTHEVYSVPINGGIVTKLNGPLVNGGSVFMAQISADGSRVVYRADQETVGQDELFSVPITGGVATKISDPLSEEAIFYFAISRDGQNVIYMTNTQLIDELYQAPITGGAITRLNATLPENTTVGSFALSQDNSRVVYSIEPVANNRGDNPPPIALFSVPLTGGFATQLTETFAVGRGVNGFLISPENSTVFYAADQDQAGTTELYGVPVTGGQPVKMNDLLVSGGEVLSLRLSPDASHVIYQADQEVDEVDELFSVSTAELITPELIFRNGFD